MSVSVNMVKCVDLLFEESENLPEDFYLGVMNLIKNYYEYGNNLQELHNFINLNKNRIDKKLFEELKSIFNIEQKSKNQVVVKQGCNIYGKLCKCCVVTCSTILICVPAAFMVCVIVVSVVNRS